MYKKVITIETGPATFLPLGHVPLLKKAPRKEGAYLVIPDNIIEGDLCHFYGDFSGYHIYMIASTLKKRIVEDSVEYHDPKNGIFSLIMEVTLDTGENKKIRVENCKSPLVQLRHSGDAFPTEIKVEKFSPGTPDALKFVFGECEPKFRFSHNLIPDISEEVRFDSPGICDLCIEYIGKSVGNDGTREIADRLGNGHTKEAAILNEFLYKRTNLDAFAILYKPGALTSGTNGPIDGSMSFSEVVDVLEKSLIASFQPPRNENSKNFPNDCSVPVKKLRDLGVSNLWITVESPLRYGLLCTNQVEREKIHRFDIQIPYY